MNRGFDTCADVRSSRPTSGGVVTRECTCHPADNPPYPCAKQYALGECKVYQRGREDALEWADKTWGETVRQTREAYQCKIDALGVAIADAGYSWTPEMREAYEMPPNGRNERETTA